MHFRDKHQFPATSDLGDFIDSNPLGTWVTEGNARLTVNHLPLYLDRTSGPCGTLIGHVARSNPVWQALDHSTPSVVVFHGPQAYITPSWYLAKQEHGKVVPTWNYAVVHAHGIARAVEDRQWLLHMLNKLTDANESAQPTPWSVDDAPPEYIDGMLKAIIGIEIPIDRLEGKLKASQDKALRERMSVAKGLSEAPSLNANLMAALVEPDG
ncbi:FMN-binding negative transcriptional regulator [Parahaliea mediterranea]|uniref:FMN-binding negative transcriptional regulator n=1 Tax=Parahaliea mediterranea TaxID=651086 RepID=UPI000E2F3835|nr:FMN-binding negative transcriptional regulator [Parahaliea mediterranea]